MPESRKQKFSGTARFAVFKRIESEKNFRGLAFFQNSAPAARVDAGIFFYMTAGMSKERFTERQNDVLESAGRLAEVVALPENEIVRDAAIHRFEFTFEAVWKTLKLYLEHQGHECAGPRAALKKAFVENLIPDAATGELWLRMLEERNLATHTYNSGLAENIYQNIVRDYAPALLAMAKKIQSLTWD